LHCNLTVDWRVAGDMVKVWRQLPLPGGIPTMMLLNTLIGISTLNSHSSIVFDVN